MDAKTISTLEFDKVLVKLAEHTAFSASRDLALRVKPSTNFHAARQMLMETSEARLLLETDPGTTIGVDGMCENKLRQPGEARC